MLAWRKKSKSMGLGKRCMIHARDAWPTRSGETRLKLLNADLFGGSQRTGTDLVSPSTNATTPLTNIATGGNDAYSSAQAKRSPSERKNRTHYSSGESSSRPTPADKSASTAPCSETRDRTYRPSLSDRLTQSLITAGLVKGITPTSIRGASNQPIRVLAFDTPDGSDAASPKAGCSSLNDNAPVNCDKQAQEGNDVSETEKHTSGPWEYSEGADGAFRIYAPCFPGASRAVFDVADVWLPDRGDRAANGRLIAAAPDLLASLRHAVKIIEEHVPRDALGMNAQGDPDVPGGFQQSPLLDEYLHSMRAALERCTPQARPERVMDTGEQP